LEQLQAVEFTVPLALGMTLQLRLHVNVELFQTKGATQAHIPSLTVPTVVVLSMRLQLTAQTGKGLGMKE